MNRKPVAAPVSISNELVIATIGLIGILVDVHVTDGSVYSGIFHAASVDGDYGIVLKKARIAKKGNLLTNIVDDTALDTLVIGSETLVQIVAKIGVNEITASVDIREERDDWNENDPNNDQDSSRWSDELRDSNLTGEHHSDDQSAFSQDALENSGQQQIEDISSGGSMKPAAGGQSIKTTDDEAVAVDSTSTTVSIASASLDNVESESQLSDSTNLSAPLSPKPTDKKKPHKLNPDARTFSPSYHRAATPVPNYIPFANYMAAAPPAILQDEVEPSSYIHSPVPVKYVPPYSDTTDDTTHGSNDAQQPTADGAAQSIRYPPGQYPNFPSIATYVYPNSQIAYGGGVMPVVIMPVPSGGVVQSSSSGVPGPSPATTPRPPPNQGHVLKYQELIAEEMIQQHSSYYYAYSWYPQQ